MPLGKHSCPSDSKLSSSHVHPAFHSTLNTKTQLKLNAKARLGHLCLFLVEWTSGWAMGASLFSASQCRHKYIYAPKFGSLVQSRFCFISFRVSASFSSSQLPSVAVCARLPLLINLRILRCIASFSVRQSLLHRRWRRKDRKRL